MRSIGIRELRQNASRYLREVEIGGEGFEVTDRGRPVARLVPVPESDTLQGLVERGRARAPAGDPLELGEPLAPRRFEPLPSDALGRSRADER